MSPSTVDVGAMTRKPPGLSASSASTPRPKEPEVEKAALRILIADDEEVLREAGISEQAPYTLFASDQFEFTPVDRPVQIAFANSVFSHLTLNSIFTALLQLKTVLAPTGVLYATFFALEQGRPWLKPHPRNKWGRQFETFPHQDPYHYPLPLLKNLARKAGFCLDVLDDFGHPTQTMGRFRQTWRQRWFR